MENVLCPYFTKGPSYRMTSFLTGSCVGFPQAAVLPALLKHGSVPQAHSSATAPHEPHREKLSQPSFPTSGCSSLAAAQASEEAVHVKNTQINQELMTLQK